MVVCTTNSGIKKTKKAVCCWGNRHRKEDRRKHGEKIIDTK